MKEQPRNGYYWTERELMLRRDHRLWLRQHRKIFLAPLPAILGWPYPAGAAYVVLLVACAVQNHYRTTPRETGRLEFDAPIRVQRVGVVLTALVSVATLQPLGLVGCLWWWLNLRGAEVHSRIESEIDAEARSAEAVIDTRIRE